MNKIIVFIATVVFLMVATMSTSAAPVPKTASTSITEKTNSKDAHPVKKEDFIETINQTLDAYPEVASNINGLKMVKEGKKVSYSLNGASLENLDDASLQGLVNKIMGAIGGIQSNAINEQANVVQQSRQTQVQLNQAQQTQAASRQAAQMQSIPKAQSMSSSQGGPNSAGGPNGPGGPGSAAGSNAPGGGQGKNPGFYYDH